MNTTASRKASGVIVLLGLLLVPSLPARAEVSNEELAKAAQNPVANLISVPFQDNINFNYGPEEKTQNVLNIQPVIPVSLGTDWNLITRTILPVISQPEFFPGEGRTNGLGDTQFTAFLSPNRTEGLIWGAGPIVQLPTNTDEVLGNDRWGLGPSAVVLRSRATGCTARLPTMSGRSAVRTAIRATTTSCSSHSSTTIFTTGCM